MQTLGCMLEGKDDMIVDSFESHSTLRTMTDTLADDKFDTAKVVGRAPVALTQKLLLKYGESDNLLLIRV
jgi:hypothetical protein